MLETDLSSWFVDKTIREYGSQIWIQKIQDPLRVGTPDIYALSRGMFIPIECKRIDHCSGNSILAHHFKKLQKVRMDDLLKVTAYPIGLVFLAKVERRYILPLDIRDDGNMSWEQYQSLPMFNWEEVIDAATKAYRSRYPW